MYEIIEQYLEDIIHKEWMTEKSKLVLFGGIMINCDFDGTDRFLPLKFEIRNLHSTEDLFEKTFGKESEIQA